MHYAAVTVRIKIVTQFKSVHLSVTRDTLMTQPMLKLSVPE